jgi:hypothetical protein
MFSPNVRVRKCILSTNIAETSVTIDGIRFVVDSGKVKEMGYDEKKHMYKLCEFWISKSSAKQRMGRAGRTGPGQCFRFYSRDEFDQLNDFPEPEILRMPLDSIALDCKVLGLGDPRQFEFLEQPTDASLSAAISKLVNLGALGDFEELKPLGIVLQSLPIDHILGKMLILGSISHLLQPILIIAASLTVQSPFARMIDQKIIQNRKELYSDHGDPFTLLNVFSSWLLAKSKSDNSGRSWARQRGLDESRLFELSKLRKQFEKTLETCGILQCLEVNQSEETEETKQQLEREMYIERKKLAKRKHENHGNVRKFLKLEESFHFIEPEDDNENEPVIYETIDEMEFRLNNDPSAILADSDVSIFALREITIMKLICASGLYPNIAISDEGNSTRPASEQVYHTKTQRFLHMMPSSVFALDPELLHGKSFFRGSSERQQKDLLCFVNLLETNKPYLVNVIRVPGLAVSLLFAKKILIDPSITNLYIDDWIHIEFEHKDDALRCLQTGTRARYAWERLINMRLEMVTNQSTSDVNESFGAHGLGTALATKPGKKAPLKWKESNWDNIPFILKEFSQMRRVWIDLQRDAELSDMDVVDQLIDLVDDECSYTVRKLKQSKLSEMVGYDPDLFLDSRLQITPNIHYLLADLDDARKFRSVLPLVRE